jgi:hypothetical protein
LDIDGRCLSGDFDYIHRLDTRKREGSSIENILNRPIDTEKRAKITIVNFILTDGFCFYSFMS